ncbi:hypothetical protein P3T73_03325 [Kiritimatiellota bacterium B12222]|nr:hypothetical protein P3T73_03325 [Kiritimatiellota bacterium B12222]
MDMALVKNDGKTLSPIASAYLVNVDTMCDYICELDEELKQYRDIYRDNGFQMLFSVFYNAASPDDLAVLNESELRSIFESGIQWPKLYGDLIGKRLSSHITYDKEGGWEISNIPFDLMSLYFEFLLFLVELTDPRINLLTVPRKRYSIARRMALTDNYKHSPVQATSQIAWRRRLLSNEEFNQAAELLRDQIGQEHWVYVFAGRLEPYNDWLVYFDDGRLEAENVRDSSDGNCNMLREFCLKYNLEMIGTYLGDYQFIERVHILPMRIHVFQSKWGVRMEIPNFYKLKTISSYMEEDFNDLNVLLKDFEKSPRTEKFLLDEGFRNIGVLIRKILKHDGKSSEEINGIINKIWMDKDGFKKYFPDKIVGVADNRSPETSSRLIKSIDGILEEMELTEEEILLWAEFYKAATFFGILSPNTYVD